MTMLIDEAYLDAFEDEMVRLSRRTYAVTGVPMYLVPEDLTGQNSEPQPDPEGEKACGFGGERKRAPHNSTGSTTTTET